MPSTPSDTTSLCLHACCSMDCSLSLASRTVVDPFPVLFLGCMRPIQLKGLKSKAPHKSRTPFSAPREQVWHNFFRVFLLRLCLYSLSWLPVLCDQRRGFPICIYWWCVGAICAGNSRQYCKSLLGGDSAQKFYSFRVSRVPAAIHWSEYYRRRGFHQLSQLYFSFAFCFLWGPVACRSLCYNHCCISFTMIHCCKSFTVVSPCTSLTVVWRSL